MANQNRKKSPKKLWKTPSPSKPSLSRPNQIQFADLEANTLEELSIKELSFVSGGDGGFDLQITPKFSLQRSEFNLTADLTIDPLFSSFINLNPPDPGSGVTTGAYFPGGVFTSITVPMTLERFLQPFSDW
ncbi:MAG: hypothetical protein F6K22_14815 [Okeania sp. SIO2F4]|uniref:hypothetical protein n=1 Tax=Okeania sp. SIO2F4 TaxID=2607790 RepID=UPI0014297200|nr:hypothetical protein [Okeania sp. SIO2F4]NES03995.1 hypothetical protein [Okeania sp. SIO2F4]